jgi:ATP-dependent DNA ligase
MRKDVEERVLPLLDESNERRFSEPNRWGTGDLEETAVRPEVVVEVRYDKVQGDRFRHGTKFIRWREDKKANDCTWRELRPPRDPNAPTVDELFG